MSNLFELISSKKLDLLRARLDAGADVDEVSDDHSLLHRAAFCGDADAVRLLVEYGAHVDHDVEGLAPIHLAAMEAEMHGPDAVDALIAAGANVNAVTDHGYTALFYAAGIGSIELIERLLAAGADIAARTEHGWTALHEAADEDESCASVTYLLERGADPDAVTDEATTPAHVAAPKSHAASTRALLTHMKRPDAVDAKGFGVIHLAALGGIGECVEWLLQRGVDANARNGVARTPLHYAAMCYRVEDNSQAIHALLARGAAIDARDESDHTPADLAYAPDAFAAAIKSAPRT